MALVRIVKAIFGDEKSVLTVSSMFRGEYDINGVYAGIPSIIGRDGVREIVTLDITAEEEKKLKESCELQKCKRRHQNLIILRVPFEMYNRYWLNIQYH